MTSAQDGRHRVLEYALQILDDPKLPTDVRWECARLVNELVDSDGGISNWKGFFNGLTWVGEDVKRTRAEKLLEQKGLTKDRIDNELRDTGTELLSALREMINEPDGEKRQLMYKEIMKIDDRWLALLDALIQLGFFEEAKMIAESYDKASDKLAQLGGYSIPGRTREEIVILRAGLAESYARGIQERRDATIMSEPQTVSHLAAS